MSVLDICTTKVVVIDKNEPLLRAAMLMKDAGVGNVLVIEGQDENRVPIGIVTDRDLVVEVLDKERDIDRLKVEDVMMSEIVTIREDLAVAECLDKMQKEKIRRAPVIDKHGHLKGIISVDDLVFELSKEVASLAKILSQH